MWGSSELQGEKKHPLCSLLCTMPIASLVSRCTCLARRQEHKPCQCSPQSCAPLLGDDTLWAESLKMETRLSQDEKVEQRDGAVWVHGGYSVPLWLLHASALSAPVL